MKTSPLIDALVADVEAVAEVADEDAARVLHRATAVLGSSLRLRLIEAAAEAAKEIAAQLPEGRVDVRVQAGEPVLVYVEEAAGSRPAAPSEEPSEARITLRLPESLKRRIESAAARDGASVNTWLVQAIARSLESRARRVGSRLTGFARS